MQDGFWPRILICAWLTLLGCSGALAQESGVGSSADELVQAGLNTLRQIEDNRAGDAWEAAAPFVKARFPKAELVGTLQKARATFGSVAQRTWASVSRVRQTTASEQGFPPGLYANIDYSTRLTDGRTVFELVSFRLELDGVWRLTGYVTRQQQ